MNILILFSFIFLSRVVTADIRQCVEQVLNVTQSCGNTNRLYVTTLGTGSGFGSEFLAYLLNSLLTAMEDNRRLVFLMAKRPWEYDCPEKRSWACYLSFSTCKDAIVDYKDMDLRNQRSVHQPLLESGASFLEHEALHHMYPARTKEIVHRFQEVLNVRKLSTDSCNSVSQSPFQGSVLAGILATHFYQTLNPVTIQSAQSINERYQHNLGSDPYLAIQLRLTDKRYETPEEDWKKLSDMSFLAGQVNSILSKYQSTLEVQSVSSAAGTGRGFHIFIATDNCTAAGELARNIHGQQHTTSKLRFFGSCFASDGRHILEEKKRWNPRDSDVHDEGHQKTYAVLADVEMLRRGSVFMGSFYSNLVRLVHYLRYPRLKDSFHLILDDKKFQNTEMMSSGGF